MKPLNVITLILVIVGGANWGLVGFLNFDLVAAIFGEASFMARAVYMLVGLSALWQLMALAATPLTGESSAASGRTPH